MTRRIVKHAGGTTTEIESITPAEREVLVDLTRGTVVVGDGITPGGHPLARMDGALNPETGVIGINIRMIIGITQSAYDALVTKDSTTLYVIRPNTLQLDVAAFSILDGGLNITT